jgi:hypothetical protein
MDVEEIYQAYPRHKDKIFAKRSIEKALRRLVAGECGRRMSESDAFNFLRSKTVAFAQSFAGQRGALTPYPATWMNRGGYLDDPNEWELITPDEEKMLRRVNEANVGVWRPQ